MSSQNASFEAERKYNELNSKPFNNSEELRKLGNEYNVLNYKNSKIIAEQCMNAASAYDELEKIKKNKPNSHLGCGLIVMIIAFIIIPIIVFYSMDFTVIPTSICSIVSAIIAIAEIIITVVTIKKNKSNQTAKSAEWEKSFEKAYDKFNGYVNKLNEIRNEYN